MENTNTLNFKIISVDTISVNTSFLVLDRIVIMNNILEIMKKVFITGFPGFIASEIVKSLSKRVDKIFFLVQKEMLKIAERKVPSEVDYEIIEGDITLHDLGIGEPPSGITHILHLAAVYDLSVDPETAYNVNVKGTENVINFAMKIKDLRHFIYFSTAYVSGLRRGKVGEEELVHGYGFKNNYEYSKYLAELIVRNHLDDLPITIIRPGIVVGDSKTGYTSKFDGLYFFLRFMYRYPSFLPMPYMGRGDVPVNIVPVDFVVEGVCRVFDNMKTIGKTYHFVDPSPLNLRELHTLFYKELKRRKPKGMIPMPLAIFLFKVLGKRFTGVVKEGLGYLTHYTAFSTDNLEKDLNLLPPSPYRYADKLVKFFIENINNREMMR